MAKACTGSEEAEHAVSGGVCRAEGLQVILCSQQVHVDLKAECRKAVADTDTIAWVASRVRRGLFSGFPLPELAGQRANEQASYLLKHWPPDQSEQDIFGAIDERCPHIPIPQHIFHALCGM